MAQKAVFLDRDDTLVDDPGYIQHPDQVRLLPGASDALIMLREMGYLLVVVTNQSAVARGMITEKELDQIHKRLKSLLAAEGADIDALYYCPYHPEGMVKDYTMESNLRKPNAGMFFQAEEELDIDLSRSWMIGDSYRDIIAGKEAGCHTILVDVPGKIREKKNSDPEPDRSAVNLREAVNIIRMFEFHEKALAAKKAADTEHHPTPETPRPAKDEPSENERDPGNKPQGLNPMTSADTQRPEPGCQEEHQPSSVATLPEPEPETEPLSDANPEPVPEVLEEKERVQKLRRNRPEQVKFYTAKDRTEMNARSQVDSPDKTQHLLEEILHQLKHKDRENLYRDFSVFKLLSLMIEVVAVFCLIVSVCFWLSQTKGFEQVLMMIGYSAALQIMVIALLMMDSKE